MQAFKDQQQALAYDQWFATPLGRWAWHCEQEALWEVLPPLNGFRVLEAGCGTGIFTLPLAARGATVVGLDRSAAMLARAQVKARDAGVAVAWLNGDVTALPFPPESFDGALCLLTLEFISSRETALRELARVLRPGGFLVLALLNRYSLWTLKRKVTAWFKPSLWREVDFLSESRAARLLTQTGFTPLTWRRALYYPPVKNPRLLRLAPLCEGLGHRLFPQTAAFLVVLCRKLQS